MAAGGLDRLEPGPSTASRIKGFFGLGGGRRGGLLFSGEWEKDRCWGVVKVVWGIIGVRVV